MTSPTVGVIMGSDSDWAVMGAAADALAEFEVAHEVRVLSAHRTPDAMLAYGVVVGSFSGGTQLWIAPAKIAMGTILSILICLPSLYIFTCLSGIDAQLRTVTGVLFAAVSLGALLLIGFAPIAWIFSQSTDSVAFMAALHIGLWAIGIMFGLRLLEVMGHLLGGSARNHLKFWSVIFIVVCLQMMTTLRPIVGTSERFLPSEKKFFLTHWAETLRDESARK